MLNDDIIGTDQEIASKGGDELVGRDRSKVLRGRIEVTLHTTWARQVFKGRRAKKGNPFIPGLNRFADDLNSIAEGSRLGDPYGDWFKDRVENALSEAEAFLKDKEDELAAVIDGIRGFSIEAAVALQPSVFELTYRSPLAFKAARLIALLDYVLRLSSTLHVIAVIEKNETQALAGRLKHVVRQAFNIARQYEFTQLTRDDVRAQTEEATEAAERLGVLPAEFLDETANQMIMASPGEDPAGSDPPASVMFSQEMPDEVAMTDGINDKESFVVS